MRYLHVEPPDQNLSGPALHEAVDLGHVGDAPFIEVTGEHLLVEALGLPAFVRLHNLIRRRSHDVHYVTVEVMSVLEVCDQSVAP